MKILLLTLSILVIKVFADDCGGEKFKELGNGVIMRCRKGVWRVSKRSQPKGPPCSDDPSLAANGTCSADRGHCQQYTVAGADMDRDCPETCESCDACRCQDASQWHAYCGYWSQYCGSSGVLGNWMTSNCRKTCGACRCKCCSYAGKQHQLGARIQLPEKCGELVCEEGLVADYSPLLQGAAGHKVSHPEELTLSFRSVHTGTDCCILPGDARSADGSSFPNGTMVQEGWAGVVEHRGAGISASCCHGILSTPLDGIDQAASTTTTTTTTTTSSTTTTTTTTSSTTTTTTTTSSTTTTTTTTSSTTTTTTTTSSTTTTTTTTSSTTTNTPKTYAFTSPNYPNRFPGNVNECWSRTPDRGHAVTLTFTAFDIHDSSTDGYANWIIISPAINGKSKFWGNNIAGPLGPPGTTRFGTNQHVSVCFYVPGATDGHRGFSATFSEN